MSVRTLGVSVSVVIRVFLRGKEWAAGHKKCMGGKEWGAGPGEQCVLARRDDTSHLQYHTLGPCLIHSSGVV